MPYLKLEITPAIDRSQKAELVRQFTRTLVDVLGKSPEHIHIVIAEVPDENWGFSGMLTDDFRKGAAQ